MKPTSEHIKDILEEDSSLGLVFKDNLFVGLEPDKPDQCVTVFDIPGEPSQITIDGKDYRYPAVQIRCRGADYLDTYNRLYDIYKELHGRSHEEYDGVLYTAIIAQSEPEFFDWDENSRVRFILKIKIQRR